MIHKWEDSSKPTASLVWATPSAEAFIAYIARVSSDNQDNPEYMKLFRYLVKHNHWSPFEHASACVEINTTRDVAAQILRHRSFCFQEFSQRYAKVKDRPKLPEMRVASKKNRQSSEDACTNVGQRAAIERAEALMDRLYEAYEDMVELGVATECARGVLPLCTSTRMYMTGNVRSWLHYLKLRLDETTQKEHRIVAEAIFKELEKCFPNIMQLVFRENT